MREYKIIHLADIHIVNNPNEHEKFRIQFDKLYKELDEIKPDRVVLAGDTLDSFIETTLEAEILAAELLNNISKRTKKVIVTIGNHEIRKKDLKRISSIKSVIQMTNNDNVILYDTSGFFEDEDLIWVNYSHLQKDIIPWENIKHKKDKDKVYVGLFHDPIFNCDLPSGISYEKANSMGLSKFEKNDLNIFGDIHLRQFFNPTTAFAGSFLQNDFGEKIENHGFLLWSIDSNKNITSTEYNIDNDYNYINLQVPIDSDYDNLNLENEFTTLHSKFKVHWTDYDTNITIENEHKIRKYISEKFTTDYSKILFKKIRLEKSSLKNIAVTSMMTLNVSDPIVQQNIMVEYLTANDLEQDYIDKILKIDDRINNRLDKTTSDETYNWTIDTIWLDNFKSYDKLRLNIGDLDGITQVHGENQQGKTTFFDGICYVLYGTTISTNTIVGGAEREKFGDGRYINNRRNLNYCEGGAIVNVNGSYYTLVRRTERELNKKKEVKSCSTTLDYYSGIEINDDNKLNGEQRKDTQKLLNAVFGQFEDFIRMTLINSENLNGLLSMVRSDFIDSIIRDAGFDIFEKKMKEFKDYKETLKLDRIEMNLNDEENKIIDINGRNLEIENTNENIKTELITDDTKLKTLNLDKENEIKKLHKFDDEFNTFNIESVNKRIEVYNLDIQENIDSTNANIKICETLTKEIDNTAFDSIKANKEIILNRINDLKDKIHEVELKISKNTNDVENIKKDIKTIIVDEVKTEQTSVEKLEVEIKNKEEEFSELKREKIRGYESEIKDKNNEISNLRISNNSIKERAAELKTEITNITESKSCPTCNREYDNLDHTHITDSINEKNNKIQLLVTDFNNNNTKIKEIETSILLITDLKDGVESGNDYGSLLEFKLTLDVEVSDIKNSIIEKNNIIDKLKAFDLTNSPELKQKVDDEKKKLSVLKTELDEYNKTIESYNEKIRIETENNLTTVESKIKEFETKRDEVIRYKTLLQDNKEYELKNKNIQLNIDNLNEKIKRYNSQLKYVEINKLIDIKIDEIKSDIEILTNTIKEKNSILSSNIITIKINNENIVEIEKNIEKFRVQMEEDEIMRKYESIIHRNGLPTYLLKKITHLINNELEDLLADVDFNMYFDDSIRLKMSPKEEPDVIQNALESSGKERTFVAVALKLALRNINNKSKSDILLLDEVMTKLLNTSVDEFRSLLDTAKSKINKLFIIEHIHQINYDHLLSVVKEKGISKMSIY